MAESDTNWRNLPPDDPRYGLWQLIRGVFQRDESRAKADCIANFETQGLLPAVLTLIEQKFDSCGRVAVTLVRDVTSAEKAAQLLSESLELTLDLYAPWFKEIERRSQIPSSELVKESRFRLTGRMEHWKAEVFQRGIEAEKPRNVVAGTAPAHVLPQAARWEDIEISFLSDERVQVTIGPETETRNYAEMGFATKKKKGTPVLAWQTLRELAEAKGAIQIASDSRKWAEVEKRIQEIRSKFKTQFGLADDPFRFAKKTRRNPDDFGYHARFKISCGPSYDS